MGRSPVAVSTASISAWSASRFMRNTPAHDGDALDVPGSVDAETRRASDGRRLPRRGRFGDALLDIRAGSELGGLVDCRA